MDLGTNNDAESMPFFLVEDDIMACGRTIRYLGSINESGRCL